MSFQLPYICKNGRHKQFIHIPDFYSGFASAEDINQIAHGLFIKNKNQPALSNIKQSAINLAKQRKEGKR